jgi:hypothetical protein
MFSTPRRRRVGWALLFTCAMAFLIAATVVVAFSVQTLNAVRSTQLEGTPTGKKLLSSAERIEECTTPGQPCFKDSQQRTADVIAEINRVAVYAASCADRPGVQGEDEIYACVVRLIAKADARKKP